MEFLAKFIDFFIHLDHHMNAVIDQYGVWTYLILFLIIFCETGLVFTPFLPGDSLLFVVGALASSGPLELKWLISLLMAAAVLGDTVNYWAGKILAPKIFHHKKIRFLKEEHLIQTEKFFAKHGAKTIIIARFLPIIRTFAPFLAGVGSMRYGKFLLYNIIGGGLWITLFILAGYFFGNLPVVKKNFTLVVFMIIFISLVPAVGEYFSHRRDKKP